MNIKALQDSQRGIIIIPIADKWLYAQSLKASTGLLKALIILGQRNPMLNK